ncbi:MAG TPA: type II CAAX endopeptidase family protein [Thermoanaerobaculia bacterium]|jgi:membrane protease YdiL (CAAX protease family)|nr:type II CAAX endopeptidase family protein [Thermoanaerobaculia bacterium]
MAIDASASSDDHFAAQLRGFGPVGIVAILAILFGNAVFIPFSAVLVIVWMRLSRTRWSEIGYVQPRSWIVTVAGGVGFGIALKLLLKTMVMPLLGADPINHAYHFLAGNRAAIPFTLFSFIVGAGWGEETVYRGFLFERLGRILGSGLAARTSIVLITSTLFALAHYSVQGLAGSEQAMITGLVFGAIFAVSGRIWMVMIAHAAYDLTAYAIIYWNLETTVAHLVFR